MTQPIDPWPEHWLETYETSETSDSFSIIYFENNSVSTETERASFPSPDDLEQGRARSLHLQSGMRLAIGLRITEAGLSDAELIALGRAAWIEANQQALQSGQVISPSATVIWLHRSGDADQAESLTITEPPRLASRKELASEILKGAGLDPQRPIKTDSLAIPAAWGPVKLEVPVPFADKLLGTRPLADYYFDKDALSENDVDKLGPANASTPVDANEIVAKLPSSLNEAFDQKFDAYKKAVTGAVTALFDRWLTAHAELEGIDLSKASITISQIKLKAVALDAPQKPDATPPQHPGDLVAESKSSGWIVSINTQGVERTYYLNLAADFLQKLPSGLATATWIQDNQRAIFAHELEELRRGYAYPVEISYSVEMLASGKQPDAVLNLKQALVKEIETLREGARGQTGPERLREMERGLLPGRSAYLALQRGNLTEAAGWAAFDVLGFLMPAALKGGLAGLGLTRAAGGMTAVGAEAVDMAFGVGERTAASAPFAQISHDTGLLDAQLANRLANRVGDEHPDLAAALNRAAHMMRGNSAGEAGDLARATTESVTAAEGSTVETPSRPDDVAAGARTASGASSSGTEQPSLVNALRIKNYEVPPPANVEPISGSVPVFRETAGSRQYIQIGDHWLPVKPGDGPDTWLVTSLDKPAPDIAVRYESDGWHAVGDTGLAGGAPVTRTINWHAAGWLDRQLPDDLPSWKGVYHDGSGHLFVSSGKLSATPTVALTRQILSQATDLTVYPWWEQQFDDLFEIKCPNLDKSLSAAVLSSDMLEKKAEDMAKSVKDMLFELYKESETFRALVNHAKATGRLSADNKWTIEIYSPERVDYAPGEDRAMSDYENIEFGVSHDDRVIKIPDMTARPDMEWAYLKRDGSVGLADADRAALQEIVSALTRETPVDRVENWVPERELNAPERGPVGYLTDRIRKEADVITEDESTPLSDFSYRPEITTPPPGEALRLQHYVGLQNQYLDALFPRSTPAPSADAAMNAVGGQPPFGGFTMANRPGTSGIQTLWQQAQPPVGAIPPRQIDAFGNSTWQSSWGQTMNPGGQPPFGGFTMADRPGTSGVQTPWQQAQPSVAPIPPRQIDAIRNSTGQSSWGQTMNPGGAPQYQLPVTAGPQQPPPTTAAAFHDGHRFPTADEFANLRTLAEGVFTPTDPVPSIGGTPVTAGGTPTLDTSDLVNLQSPYDLRTPVVSVSSSQGDPVGASTAQSSSGQQARLAAQPNSEAPRIEGPQQSSSAASSAEMGQPAAGEGLPRSASSARKRPAETGEASDDVEAKVRKPDPE
jgi:hypothetical protein